MALSVPGQQSLIQQSLIRLKFNEVFVLFCLERGLWDWASILQSRRSNLSHTSNTFCSAYFGDGVLWTFAPAGLEPPYLNLPSR
jgi:hypothetical protein